MSKVIENYVLKEVIGSGQYGKVFKSTHQKTGQVFAVKVIKLEKFKSVPKLHEFTNNEIQTLTKLNNPNVITFIEMLRTSNNVYLVYEFCNGGTLEDIIKKKKFLNEKEALVIFQQILNAFKSLFKENILHRDLKPSNILLHDGIIKVADFGFCKTLLSPQDLTQTMVGSPIYMAPEILKGNNYNIKADIWSMGVVLFEMLFGFCPYEDKTIARLIGQIDTKLLQIPKSINPISSKVEELLYKMLTVDPAKRIEWNTLLNYPLFEKSPILNQPSLNIQTQQPQLQQQQSVNSPLIANQNLQNFGNKPFTAANTIGIQQGQQPQQQQQQQQLIQNNANAKKKNDVLDQIQASKFQQVKNFVNIRNKILYQVKALNNILEINVEEQAPILSFMLMKNVSNQTENLRSQISQYCIQEQENQQVQQFSQIVSKEIDFVQNCLDSFKEEIDKLIQYNIYFSSNINLKKEQTSIGVDYEYFKLCLIKYIEAIKNKYGLNDLSQISTSTSLLKYAQHLNEILNCFLIDDYFENQLDPKYNDLDNQSKTSDMTSITPIIQYKIDLAKSKPKPSDKFYLYG
ncbi:Serine/Threonine kinase domain protein (macronuclear) [Tetrahymena thermophila SB210]|uniref:Serine/Threonine kinase domain protein n=1 Tax=Tetrahymena thermophila (strain SB210) TaxID=312017 RepID=Q23DB7_TETTS|nr:Serine/Threonine kinase domain protein [Tetrahymena thermophila SB210]EAR94331.2 Serine/Threonine kinase domain protein [Tetrahymena thermophila SB210]|eukprot:XP_001014769.2 Serine/Threonine kinase domain protein [Tetrahymena thermophila SB210]